MYKYMYSTVRNADVGQNCSSIEADLATRKGGVSKSGRSPSIPTFFECKLQFSVLQLVREIVWNLNYTQPRWHAEIVWNTIWINFIGKIKQKDWKMVRKSGSTPPPPISLILRGSVLRWCNIHICRAISWYSSEIYMYSTWIYSRLINRFLIMFCTCRPLGKIKYSSNVIIIHWVSAVRHSLFKTYSIKEIKFLGIN